MSQIDKKIREFKLITYVIFSFFLVLILVLFWFFSRAYLSVEITPKDAVVTVDNSPVKLNRFGRGKIASTPGDHIVKVEAEGYIGVLREIGFKRGFTTKFSFSLSEMPVQELVEEGGKFLDKGKEANEFVYLGQNGTTLMKASVSPKDKKEVVISKQALTDKRTFDFEQIVWSPNKDLALLKSGTTIQLFDFQKYDFVNQTQNIWGENIGDLSWAPDNSKIAYFYAPPTGERSIVFSNLDNSVMTRVLNLNEIDYNIQNPLLRWSPDSRWLLLIPRGKPYSDNKIFIFDSYTNSLKALTENGDQIEAKFSPDSKKIIYSTYSQDINSSVPYIVSVMNLDGSNQYSLDLRVDLSRVIWKNDSRNLLVSEVNQETGLGYVSVFDTKLIQKNSSFLVLPDQKEAILLQISNDDIMFTYQTKDGIYASRLEE